jgi:hypothetical protein
MHHLFAIAAAAISDIAWKNCNRIAFLASQAA